MEFAQAAAPLGAQGDPRRGDRPRRRAPRHAAGRGRAGLAEPLPSAHPRACAHARAGGTRRRRDVRRAAPVAGRDPHAAGRRRRRRSRSTALAEHAAGLVCLSGCATNGVHDEPTLRRAAGRLRPRPACGSSCSGRSCATTARATARWPSSPHGWRVPTVATGNVHAHARERAPLQDAFVALRNHTTLDASEPLRRGNFSHVLASPQAMAARFPEHPDAVAQTRELAAPPAVRPERDLGYRYPGSEDEDGARQARRAVLDPARTSATRAPSRTPPRRARGSSRSCR